MDIWNPQHHAFAMAHERMHAIVRANNGHAPYQAKFHLTITLDCFDRHGADITMDAFTAALEAEVFDARHSRCDRVNKHVGHAPSMSKWNGRDYLPLSYHDL